MKTEFTVTNVRPVEDRVSERTGEAYKSQCVYLEMREGDQTHRLYYRLYAAQLEALGGMARPGMVLSADLQLDTVVRGQGVFNEVRLRNVHLAIA